MPASHHAGDARRVHCAVITVSDTRRHEDDTSGQLAQRLLSEAGHAVVAYSIVRDEPAEITAAIAACPPEVEVILTNGGTGIALRDTTFEALRRLLDKEITGF
ncbi:MAG TPA: molybdopterin-binding protein, partial [Terriglobales bacterium]|nr:molybdopterin-binding protein [Terriglobales bacterium]